MSPAKIAISDTGSAAERARRPLAAHVRACAGSWRCWRSAMTCALGALLAPLRRDRLRGASSGLRRLRERRFEFWPAIDRGRISPVRAVHRRGVVAERH